MLHKDSPLRQGLITDFPNLTFYPYRRLLRRARRWLRRLVRGHCQPAGNCSSIGDNGDDFGRSFRSDTSNILPLQMVFIARIQLYRVSRLASTCDTGLNPRENNRAVRTPQQHLVPQTM